MFGLLAGLAAGVAHALSGPDHLAAVAPLAVDAPRGAWKVGLRWGAGHALAVGALGAFALLLRDRLDLGSVSEQGETLAGVALVALGLWGLRRALSRYVHVQPFAHAPHPHRHAAFGFGVLHGVAGTAHFLGVLPALVLPGAAEAAAYVASFAVGTLAAMASCAAVLGTLSVTVGQGVRARRWILSSAASLSLCVGLAWLLG